MSNFTPQQLLQQIGGQQLHLHCKAIAPATNKQSLELLCHGQLTDRLLLAMTRIGVRHVQISGLSQCSRCPTRRGKQRLLQTLQLRSSIQQQFPAIATDSTEVSFHAKEKSEQTDVPRVSVSRRHFLDRLFKSTGKLAAYAAVQTLPIHLPDLANKQTITDSSVLTAQDYANKHVPSQLRLAEQTARTLLNRNDNHAGLFDWFTQILGDGICDACGNCATLCPTGAINRTQESIYWMIRFRSVDCIGCMLCIAACPKHALKHATISDKTFITEQRITTLYLCQEIACRRCKRIFISSEDTTALCPTCRHEQNIENDLFGHADFFRTTNPGREL